VTGSLTKTTMYRISKEKKRKIMVSETHEEAQMQSHSK
jgi:hypothetical protein|tara:strand:+ start:444 stop:557 length:114 start_codon:yes stop_codon:yes gene_type:complete